VETITVANYPFSLVVWNDEVNTFEWVIDSLMDICQHTEEQAEQCAMIIHFQGKYAVKNGEFDTLKVMRDAIAERNINATIEEVATR
jgi:ATP-dependent Clp protease adaptor protein ClpS